MTRINVRCCCRPEKILGTLEVDDPKQDHFEVLRRPEAITADAGYGPLLTDTVEIRDIYRYGGEGEYLEERAIYSDDRPPEFWISVAGFEPS